MRTINIFSQTAANFVFQDHRSAGTADIAKLGLQPNVYSPHFSLVDELTVNYCRQRAIKIVPWTINETADMERMKTFDLDGIITDYPNRAIEIFRK